MKRKVLALMVPALLMASAANAAEIYNKNGNKLDLYGKVDGLHYFSDDASEDGDQTYVRFGLKGETQITSELTGYGQWEYNIQANTSEKEGANSWTRLGFAGLKFADCGSLDYGRNYGVVYDIESWTDMLPEFGGDTYTQTDVYMTGRTNGVATYRNSDFFGLVDGLHFALQYQGNNENAGSGEGTKTVGNVSWRGKMATVLVSPATTISIWASASGQRIRLLTVPITSWRPRVAASVMPTAIKPMPGPSARNMTPITSIWPPCMLRPAT